MSNLKQAAVRTVQSVALWLAIAALVAVPWWCGRTVSTARKLPPSPPKYTDGDVRDTIRRLESQGGSSVEDSLDD